MTKTEKQFKELYNQALGGFKHGEDRLDKCCGLSDDFIIKAEKHLKRVLKSKQKEKDEPIEGVKSELYQEVLYELEPENMMEIFFIGHILGCFEAWQSRHAGKDDGLAINRHKQRLLGLAVKAHYATLDIALEKGDNKRAEELHENFRRLLENTLIEN